MRKKKDTRSRAVDRLIAKDRRTARQAPTDDHRVVEEKGMLSHYEYLQNEAMVEQKDLQQSRDEAVQVLTPKDFPGGRQPGLVRDARVEVSHLTWFFIAALLIDFGLWVSAAAAFFWQQVPLVGQISGFIAAAILAAFFHGLAGAIKVSENAQARIIRIRRALRLVGITCAVLLAVLGALRFIPIPFWATEVAAGLLAVLLPIAIGLATGMRGYLKTSLVRPSDRLDELGDVIRRLGHRIQETQTSLRLYQPQQDLFETKVS